MTSRRALWLVGVAGVMLLLAGLGCSVCPFIPQPSTVTPSPPSEPTDTLSPEVTPTPRPTSTPEPTPTSEVPPTPEVPTGMAVYTNPIAGFSIAYPADWVYDEEPGAAYFAENAEAIDSDDPTEAGVVVIFAGSPGDMGGLIEEEAAPEDVLNGLVEGFGDEEGFESGDIELWTFGAIPGAGVEIGWQDEFTEVSIKGYVVAAVGEEVVGLGLAAAPTDDWDSFGSAFQDMLATLVFFPPETYGGGEIGYGDTVEGALTTSIEHEWSFEGQTGDVVTIAMDATDSQLDCYLELYSPDGDLVIDDDDGGDGFNALIADYTLGYDGTWRIVARTSFGTSGTYELNLEQVELIIEGTLLYGDEATAALETGARHHWLFDGEEGDIATISMIALGEDLDPYLELYAPSGEQVETDDDSGGDSNAEISQFELPGSGTYRIVARGYGSDDEGEYELTLAGP